MNRPIAHNPTESDYHLHLLNSIAIIAFRSSATCQMDLSLTELYFSIIVKKKMLQQCVHVKYIYICLKLLFTIKYLQANIFSRPHKQFTINTNMYFVLLLSVPPPLQKKIKNKKCLYNVALLHLHKSSYITIPVFLAQSKNSYKKYYVLFQYHRCWHRLMYE